MQTLSALLGPSRSSIPASISLSLPRRLSWRGALCGVVPIRSWASQPLSALGLSFKQTACRTAPPPSPSGTAARAGHAMGAG